VHLTAHRRNPAPVEETTGLRFHGGLWVALAFRPAAWPIVDLRSRFEFSVKIPYGANGIDSHIKTNVAIREGQKLVLGKIRQLPAEHADLFLVLATKVR
jgi:hypothetical protein